MTKEERRAYQRRYYKEHIEHAKEYQREYAKCRRPANSTCGRKAKFIERRERSKRAYRGYDLQHASPDKLQRIFEQITAGQVTYVGI